MKRFLLLTAVSLAVLTSGAIGQTNVQSIKLDDETLSVLRAATRDEWFSKQALFSTVLGGVLAAVAGFWATWYAHHLEARHKKVEDAEFVSNVVSAIRRELEVMRDIYAEGIGAALVRVPNGQEFGVKLALTQDWFTVFTGNAPHLGRIERELSRQIVTSYALLKALIEEYRINNELIDRRNEIELRLPFTAQADQTRQQIEQVRLWMVTEAEKLKEVDKLLKAAVIELFRLLDERGIK